jgi:hypothetical protein
MNACRMAKTSFIVLTIGIACCAAPAFASPAFGITATNVTMPMSGNGTSTYTVVGIPITGGLTMSCQYSGPDTSARIPSCGGGPVDLIPVSQGQTVTGVFGFVPYGSAMPVNRKKSNHSGAGAAILSLAGVLFFGFGPGRKIGGRLNTLLVAICAFAILPAITGCGGNSNGMTPGTYPYSITAANQTSNGSNTSPAQQVSITINVTVP